MLHAPSHFHGSGGLYSTGTVTHHSSINLSNGDTSGCPQMAHGLIHGDCSPCSLNDGQCQVRDQAWQYIVHLDNIVQHPFTQAPFQEHFYCPLCECERAVWRSVHPHDTCGSENKSDFWGQQGMLFLIWKFHRLAKYSALAPQLSPIYLTLKVRLPHALQLRFARRFWTHSSHSTASGRYKQAENQYCSESFHSRKYSEEYSSDMKGTCTGRCYSHSISTLRTLV